MALKETVSTGTPTAVRASRTAKACGTQEKFLDDESKQAMQGSACTHCWPFSQAVMAALKQTVFEEKIESCCQGLQQIGALICCKQVL